MSSRLGIAGIVLLAAFGLAACGGGGGTTASTDGDTAMEQTPQQMCEAAGGRWNADETCTSAADLAAETAANTKAALTKETAIAAEAAQTADAGLGGDGITIGTGDGNYSLGIERDNDGTTITVTVHGATEADAETFMGDQPGQMLTRTMEATDTADAMTEVAIVYTDIEAPTATPFEDVHMLDVNTDTTNDDGGVTNEALNLGSSPDATVRARVMSASFPAASGVPETATYSFAFDDTNTADMDEAAEVAGTYDGAMGTYRCHGSSDCTVTVDQKGAITAMSDGWIFTPADGAEVDVADTEYLHYGFWLKRTTGEDGAVTYNEVETFAGSSAPASGGVTDVSGIATYNGGAAGVYVHKTFATDGTSEATSGHFTANASLTAYFSGGDTPANKADTLTGTIDNFVLSGGEEQDWSVTLQSDSDLSTDGIQSSVDGTHSGTANGADGSFSATFHGSVADDGDSETPIPQPHTIVGEFNSTFSNGSVAGSFGARKAE